MATVSVIIPTFNRARKVVRAVTSVLSQTYADLEVLVVDDASTDDTASALAPFSGRIATFAHASNRGVSAARNTGIRKSSGPLIAFLDSDDYWLPEKAALQIAFFMGFKEVFLIGVDHNFKDTGIPNIVKERKSSVDHNHFHPDYFPKGSRWQLPDLPRSEMAYYLAKNAFENDGRIIRDATVDGKLEVFPKVNFFDLF